MTAFAVAKKTGELTKTPLLTPPLNSKHHWPLSAVQMKKHHPDGRMDSSPGLASKEHGKKIYDWTTEATAKKITDLRCF